MKVLILISLIISSCSSFKSLKEKALLGDDFDKNGVRDDVDLWIESQPISENSKKALELISKNSRLMLKHHRNKDLSNKYMKNRLNGRGCVYLLEENFNEAKKMLDSLTEIDFNNRVRMRGYAISNKNFSGQVSTSKNSPQEACDFDLN